MFVDTNSILEAIRVGLWATITSRFKIETVTTCEGEACTVPKAASSFTVDPEQLRKSLAECHVVDIRQRIALEAKTELHKILLHDGERDLWAHVLSRPSTDDSWFLCGPDMASMRFGFLEGYRDRMVSLEELSRVVGHRCRPPLGIGHTKKWSADFMTEQLLNIRVRS